MRIAFLGLGRMGSAIARRLRQGGHELTVWNRTRSHAQPLAAIGAHVANSPAEAVVDAEVIFTMVMDDAALEEIFYAGGMLKAMREGAIHVCLSTISVELSQRLAGEHRSHQQHYVAAPVFGRPNVAEEGKLWTVVGGAEQPVAIVRPLLESFSRGVSVVSSDPWGAHALKLGGNFLITAMIASVSEAAVYAEAHGVEPSTFIETVNQALFRSPFYEAYGRLMLHPPEQPSASIALGSKDMRLFREAAQSAHVETPLADHFAATLQRAQDAGMKDRDWAAGYYQFVRDSSRK